MNFRCFKLVQYSLRLIKIEYNRLMKNCGVEVCVRSGLGGPIANQTASCHVPSVLRLLMVNIYCRFGAGRM